MSMSAPKLDITGGMRIERPFQFPIDRHSTGAPGSRPTGSRSGAGGSSRPESRQRDSQLRQMHRDDLYTGREYNGMKYSMCFFRATRISCHYAATAKALRPNPIGSEASRYTHE